MRLTRRAAVETKDAAKRSRTGVARRGVGWGGMAMAAAIAGVMLVPMGCSKAATAPEGGVASPAGTSPAAAAPVAAPIAATSPAAIPTAAVPAAAVRPVAPVPAAARVPVTTPMVRKNLYPPIADARKDIAAGIAQARRTHRRVLLDFGGDWCPDCQVLDIYFHEAPNARLLAKNFVKVNVNIGHMDANLDVAHQYGVPVQGVPALAVLDGQGKVVYAQNKEFDDMRSMQPSAVTEFLNKWKR